MRARNPLPWLGLLLALYLALPVVGLGVQVRSGHAAVLGSPGLGAALGVSCLTASITTVVCAVLGVPLALLLAGRRGMPARLVGGLVMLPLALPPLMAGVLLVSVVGPDTFLGRLTGGRLTDSLAGIVLAQTFVAAPFTVVAARSAFAGVDRALVDVAATLGLGPTRRLARVWLPVAGRAIGAGLFLTWLRAFGEFGATVVVAYHPYSLPVLTYERFGAAGLGGATAPTLVALATGAALLVVAGVRLPRRRRPAPPEVGVGVVVPAATPPEPEPSPPAVPAPAAPAPAAPAPADGRGGPVSFRVDTRLGSFHLQVSHRSASPHLAVLGASGAGKTTLLRTLAGLTGRGDELVVGGRSLGGLPSEQRRLGYVPQAPALLPGRAVWEQVAFGAGTEAAAAADWTTRLGLRGLEDRRPDQLSGGQQHRVALARALASAPGLVLLDEPFTGLEAPVRAELCRLLRRVLRAEGCASILVTHDPEEAATLADELLVIDGGRVLQAGPTAAVLGRPATPTVARLLGIGNLQTGHLGPAGEVRARSLSLAAADATRLPAGTPVMWGIRPERLRLYPSRGPVAGGGGLPGTVVDVVSLGTATDLLVRLDGGVELRVRSADVAPAAVGDSCTVEVPPEHLHVWTRASFPLEIDTVIAISEKKFDRYGARLPTA